MMFIDIEMSLPTRGPNLFLLMEWLFVTNFHYYLCVGIFILS